MPLPKWVIKLAETSTGDLLLPIAFSLSVNTKLISSSLRFDRFSVPLTTYVVVNINQLVVLLKSPSEGFFIDITSEKTSGQISE